MFLLPFTLVTCNTQHVIYVLLKHAVPLQEVKISRGVAMLERVFKGLLQPAEKR